MEKEEEEEERGGGFMVMVYDLQGEPKMFRFFLVRVSDPGVAGAEPRDAHDLTGHEIMLVFRSHASSAATVEQGKIHKIHREIVFRTTDRGR